MDGKYVEPDKAVGADWIFEIEFDDKDKNLILIILVVETKEMFFSKTYKIKWFLLEYLSVERPSYFSRCIEESVAEIMKELDIGCTVDIQLFEIDQAKGNKAIEVVLL